MKPPAPYDGILTTKAKKLARTLPKSAIMKYEPQIREMLEEIRATAQLNAIITDGKHVDFNHRYYRGKLDDYLELIETYMKAFAGGNNSMPAMRLLLENFRLIVTGEFGLEAKIKGFNNKTIKELEDFFEHLRQKYKGSKQIEAHEAERRDKRIGTLEERIQLSRLGKKPFVSRPSHPSQDSP